MFAPNSAHRAQVTPVKRGKGNKARMLHATDDPTPAARRAATTWAQRLKRVFNIDTETCNTCGGRVKIIACIEDSVVIEKILTRLDSKAACAAARRLPPCRGGRGAHRCHDGPTRNRRAGGADNTPPLRAEPSLRQSRLRSGVSRSAAVSCSSVAQVPQHRVNGVGFGGHRGSDGAPH